MTTGHVTYVEGFKSLGVHALGIVNLVAVVVVVVLIVIVIDDLRSAGAQVLDAHADISFHRVVAS